MIILSTGSLYNYGTARAFEMAARAGYDGVEIVIDGRWDTQDPAYLKRLSAEHRLPIVALHSPFVGRVPDWPPDQLGRLERTVALAQELTVPVVVTHLPFRVGGVLMRFHGFGYRQLIVPIPWPRREPYYHALCDGRIQEMAASAGVVIAVENMPTRRFLGRQLNIFWFNEMEHLQRFPYLTLDTTHVGTWGLDLLAVYRELGERVAHVHLSNYDGREHRSPPDGQLPLAELLSSLRDDDYRGAVSVECEPQALDAHDASRCQAAIEKALAFCREYLDG